MKFPVLTSTLIAGALIFSGCENKKRINDDDDVITVGVLAPLTGANAIYGEVTRQGVDLAVQEINDVAGKNVLKVVYEDDRMSPKDGVNAFKRLVADKDPAVIIGPFGSSVVLAVAPQANETETIIISASATADGIAQAGDFVFRITPPNSKQGSDIADFSHNILNKNSAAIIFQKNDYGQTLRSSFEGAFKGHGGTIISIEGVASETTDFRAIISKLKVAKPEIVFFPLHSQEATLFLRQAGELGLDSIFISADGAMTSTLIKGAGVASEGAYFSTLALAYGKADAEISKFNTTFNAKYNTQPDAYAPYYYDVTKLVYQAISTVGNDSKSVRDYFYSLGGEATYSGITGETQFDLNGEVSKSFYIFKVKDGKFVRYDE